MENITKYSIKPILPKVFLWPSMLLESFPLFFLGEIFPSGVESIRRWTVVKKARAPPLSTHRMRGWGSLKSPTDPFVSDISGGHSSFRHTNDTKLTLKLRLGQFARAASRYFKFKTKVYLSSRSKFMHSEQLRSTPDSIHSVIYRRSCGLWFRMQTRKLPEGDSDIRTWKLSGDEVRICTETSGIF